LQQFALEVVAFLLKVSYLSALGNDALQLSQPSLSIAVSNLQLLSRFGHLFDFFLMLPICFLLLSSQLTELLRLSHEFFIVAGSYTVADYFDILSQVRNDGVQGMFLLLERC